MSKPTIYRITHLWPNKLEKRDSTTAQIQQEGWMLWRYIRIPDDPWKLETRFTGDEADVERIEVVPAPSSTVQIKPETDEPNALPSRFVSLQDYERLERAGHRVLILDDAEPGEVSEAHVAVIGELRAALSSEATKGET